MQGCIVLVVRRAMLLAAQTFRHRVVSERVLIKGDQRKAGRSPVTEIGIWVGEIIRNGIGCTSICA